MGVITMGSRLLISIVKQLVLTCISCPSHSSDLDVVVFFSHREGHLSVAQLLLDHGAQVNRPSGSENNIPLTLACWKGHRDVVNLLLKNVSNIEHQNKAGCTPLMLAARSVETANHGRS